MDEEPDITARRHRGNPESKAAFANSRARHGYQRMAVATAILKSVSRGLTAQEIEPLTDLPPNCVSARCSELKELGYVLRKKTGCEPSGKPRYETRSTKSGCKAAVLIWNPAVRFSVELFFRNGNGSTAK